MDDLGRSRSWLPGGGSWSVFSGHGQGSQRQHRRGQAAPGAGAQGTNSHDWVLGPIDCWPLTLADPLVPGPTLSMRWKRWLATTPPPSEGGDRR